MTRNQRIKNALRAAGVTQEALAEKLNVSQAAVGKQLNKPDDIDSVDFIKAVAELTGKSEDWLKGTVVEEPNELYNSSEMDEVYRNIVEGHTEYLLIPRSVLQDKYRIVAIEQINRDNELMDKLLDRNEKLIDELVSLKTKLMGPQKTK